MRSLNKLINRFEWALKNKKPINPNREDLEALNELSDYFQTQKFNSNLEDSLLLFWVFCNWKLAIEESKVKFEEEKRGYLVLPELSLVFDKLCLLLNPKVFMINEITTDLQLAQRKLGNTISITESEVESILEDALRVVKEMKQPISQLSKFEKLIMPKTKSK